MEPLVPRLAPVRGVCLANNEDGHSSSVTAMHEGASKCGLGTGQALRLGTFVVYGTTSLKFERLWVANTSEIRAWIYFRSSGVSRFENFAVLFTSWNFKVVRHHRPAAHKSFTSV
jgi:hypothetical protein